MTVAHLLGLDNANGSFYLFYSGIVGNLSIFGAILYHVRRYNCHVKGCYRIGRHPVEGTPYVVCTRHYPGMDDQKVSVEHINYLHRKFLKEK